MIIKHTKQDILDALKSSTFNVYIQGTSYHTRITNVKTEKGKIKVHAQSGWLNLTDDMVLIQQ